MKKILSILLALALVLSSASALAAKNDANYSLVDEGGVVLQDQPDRGIKPAEGALEINPIIEGESPTTGMPWDTSSLYLPMLIQISNPEGSEKINGTTVKAAGIGERAPWGGQYADIVYEGILYRTGETRITFLLNDSFVDGQPTSVGPVRSARIGHVLLREEWQGGIVYAGGPRAEENNIAQMFAELGASEKGVTFNLLDGKYQDYKYRVKNVKAPDNYNVNAAGIRTLIPDTNNAQPHPFLFADFSPYTTEEYPQAYQINLDWGHKKYISSFVYDPNENLYYRYMDSTDKKGNITAMAPYTTFAEAEDRSAENEEQLSFSNLIIQRVSYEYTNNSKIMPVMQSVGQGNADIFIGGRYIAGYWVRESIESPTVFLDDQGNEIVLTRGKTYIAHMPPTARLIYDTEIQ